MSRYVVHFTKSYEVLSQILGEGCINGTGPFGWGKNVAEVMDAHRSACLSEVPLENLQRLVERHGEWGLGFTKEYVASSGGDRVWYVEEEGVLGKEIFNLVGELLRSQDLASPIWKMTPFIDRMSRSHYGYRFEWEREWRVPGGLRFQHDEIAFLVVPEEGGGRQWVCCTFR